MEEQLKRAAELLVSWQRLLWHLEPGTDEYQIEENRVMRNTSKLLDELEK